MIMVYTCIIVKQFVVVCFDFQMNVMNVKGINLLFEDVVQVVNPLHDESEGDREEDQGPQVDREEGKVGQVDVDDVNAVQFVALAPYAGVLDVEGEEHELVSHVQFVLNNHVQVAGKQEEAHELWIHTVYYKYL